jgi:hypothetical protein
MTLRWLRVREGAVAGPPCAVQGHPRLHHQGTTFHLLLPVFLVTCPCLTHIPYALLIPQTVRGDAALKLPAQGVRGLYAGALIYCLKVTQYTGAVVQRLVLTCSTITTPDDAREGHRVHGVRMGAPHLHPQLPPDTHLTSDASANNSNSAASRTHQSMWWCWSIHKISCFIMCLRANNFVFLQTILP